MSLRSSLQITRKNHLDQLTRLVTSHFTTKLKSSSRCLALKVIWRSFQCSTSRGLHKLDQTLTISLEQFTYFAEKSKREHHQVAYTGSPTSWIHNAFSSHANRQTDRQTERQRETEHISNWFTNVTSKARQTQPSSLFASDTWVRLYFSVYYYTNVH